VAQSEIFRGFCAMAKCPNCDVQISWDSAACSACSAVFSETSTWRPLPESREERQHLQERYSEFYRSAASSAPRDPQNPYAPPEASVVDVGTPAEPGRPAMVWVITIIFGLSETWVLVFYGLLGSGVLSGVAPLQTYFANLSVADVALSVGSALLRLVGLVLLFLMRANAAHVLAAALFISIARTVYAVASRNLFGTLAGPTAFGMLIGFLIWGAIVSYAYHLKGKGSLR
jgi:hypothetical protein